MRWLIKLTRIAFALGFIIFSGLKDARADTVAETLDSFISKSDIVVEGKVINRLDATDRNVQGYVGESETAVQLQFGTSQESFLKISKVHKGNEQVNQIIGIYAYPEISKDVTELVLDKEYLLFLKRRKMQDGYVIVDFGRGAWRIFDYKGIRKVKAWDQFPALRDATSYQNYDTFISALEEDLFLVR